MPTPTPLLHPTPPFKRMKQRVKLFFSFFLVHLLKLISFVYRFKRFHWGYYHRCQWALSGKGTALYRHVRSRADLILIVDNGNFQCAHLKTKHYWKINLHMGIGNNNDEYKVSCSVQKRNSLSINALCACVYIYIWQLSCSRCGLSIWLLLLAIFNTLLCLCQLFFLWENGQNTKVHHSRMTRKWPPKVTTVGVQSINTEKDSLKSRVLLYR